METTTSPAQAPVQAPAATAETQPQNVAPRGYVRPRADITETTHGFVVQVEMPGVSRQGLEITFEHGELTLTGHRNQKATAVGSELLHRESRPSDFRRTFELDQSIDAAGIAATLDQGLLTLTLPKAEAAKPRRIEVGGLN